MRLWHEALIPHLSNKRLSGQHRECCALRGKGWGRKHKTVDYVFKYSPRRLYDYHMKVIEEMKRRGFKVDDRWLDVTHRGEHCQPYTSRVQIYSEPEEIRCKTNPDGYVYPEHDNAYLEECVNLLKQKGDKSYVRD